MDIELLSSKYKVIKLHKEHIPDILRLCSGNPMFYEYCPPAVSIDGILSDMSALPPGKAAQDKYYIGFYQCNSLVAVMDLIEHYPDDVTAFIGFFMMDKAMQGNGIATTIISECCEYLKTTGVQKVKLGYAKGNPQSEFFWLKNHFREIGTERSAEGYIIVVMERTL